MKWKTALGMISLLVSVAVLAGCGAEKQGAAEQGKTKLTVFAAASMTETMNEIAKAYQQEHPDIEIVYNFDSSGTLKQQIQNGAACDLFISAAQKQMDQLDASMDERANRKSWISCSRGRGSICWKTKSSWRRRREIRSRLPALTTWRRSLKTALSAWSWATATCL